MCVCPLACLCVFAFCSCPSDAEEQAALYNMACCYAQMGQKAAVLTCLEAVLESGGAGEGRGGEGRGGAMPGQRQEGPKRAGED